MAVLVLRDLVHSFGGPPVLEGASLRVERGDRLCLFGRNGEGKSTLLRIVAGEQKPDSGSVDIERGARIGTLPQDVPEAFDGTVLEVVRAGLDGIQESLDRYQLAVDAVSEDPGEANLARLERAQAELDAVGGWEAQHRIETVLSRLGLDGSTPFATLSGGWRRRAFLARALAENPDVLLLDEPTNHLDIAAIQWLESFLVGFDGAIVFVTHDRAFLRRLATRIVDLDRGTLTEFSADFDRYLEEKEHALEIEERHDAQFDKRLAEEEVWIRTGIKARRTRNEGRVRALKAMREKHRARRKRKGAASIAIQTAERSGEMVVEAEGLSFAYPGGDPLVRNLDLRLTRGDRLGLIGPNGVGKTTLLKVLLEQLEPTAGTVRHGTRLQVRYYDQLRANLDESRTVAETISPDSDTVVIGDQPIHIIRYLQNFLFDADQTRAPVRVLSGGERNRLLLAKLFSEPANVLVLDEPTNDLDIETLEVLEERILGFDGTVLVVSHDREFLDNVATQSLVFEGDGVITKIVGGYAEWERVRDTRRPAEPEPAPMQQKVEPEPQRPPSKKLTYGERLELEALPEKLEALESDVAALHEKLADPALHRDHAAASAVMEELDARNAELEAAFARWEELEERSN